MIWVPFFQFSSSVVGFGLFLGAVHFWTVYLLTVSGCVLGLSLFFLWFVVVFFRGLGL